MAEQWIIDVLKDLKDFAERNDLPALEDKLSATLKTAHSTMRVGDGASIAQPEKPVAGQRH